MQNLLAKLLKREDLDFQEAHQAISWIMSDQASPVVAAAFLSMLQAKGATPDEIAGAATAMREKSTRIQGPENAIDTCSTGGNGISTFNISTCAAFIAAAAGAVVAKHGNRSNTRKSGSAEALQALKVNIDLDIQNVEKCLAELGICFCYAIKHHPAMKFAGPIRKELGIPTIFNILGPLTNPAGAKRQLIGVPNRATVDLLAESLKRMGAVQALVVHSDDGLCELSTTNTTYVAELRNGGIQHYLLESTDFNLPKGKLDDLRIDTPEQSAQMIRDILSGTNQGTARNVAVLNAAGALVVAGISTDLAAGVIKAQEAIDNGSALQKLEALVEFTNR